MRGSPSAPELDHQQKHDHRIVVQEESNDLVADWEASYFGCKDMWSRAEATVAQQEANVGNHRI